MSVDIQPFGEFSVAKIRESIWHILRDTVLCSMATVTPTRESHINVAFYCFNDDLKLFFLSDPRVDHSKNLLLAPSLSVAVFDSAQIWGGPLRGLQLFGKCRLAEGSEALLAPQLYSQRFQAYEEYLRQLTPQERADFPSRFYVFVPESVKILDETVFGEETYVTVRIVRPSGG